MPTRGAERETWAQLIRSARRAASMTASIPAPPRPAGTRHTSCRVARGRDRPGDQFGAELGVADQGAQLFALPFFPEQSPRCGIDRRVRRCVAAHGHRRRVIALAWGDNGFREISTSDRPIRNPADLKGLRVRVGGPAIFDDIVATLGAVPVRIWVDAQKDCSPVR